MAVVRGRQSNRQTWCLIREENGEGSVRDDPRLWLEQHDGLCEARERSCRLRLENEGSPSGCGEFEELTRQLSGGDQ